MDHFSPPHCPVDHSSDGLPLQAPIARASSSTYAAQWNTATPPSGTAAPLWNDDTSFFASEQLQAPSSFAFHSSYGSYQTVSLPYSRFLTPSPEPNLLEMLLGLERGLPVITEEGLSLMTRVAEEDVAGNTTSGENTLSSSTQPSVWRTFGDDDALSGGGRRNGSPLGDPFHIVSSTMVRMESDPTDAHVNKLTGNHHEFPSLDYTRRSTIHIPHYTHNQLEPLGANGRSTPREMSFEEQQIQLRAAASLDGFMMATVGHRAASVQQHSISAPVGNDMSPNDNYYNDPYRSIHLQRPQPQLEQQQQQQCQHQQQQQHEQQQQHQQQQHQYQKRDEPPQPTAYTQTYLPQQPPPAPFYFDQPSSQLSSNPTYDSAASSSHPLANLVVLPSPQSAHFGVARNGNEQEMHDRADQYRHSSRLSTSHSQLQNSASSSFASSSRPSPLPMPSRPPQGLDISNGVGIEEVTATAAASSNKRSKRTAKGTSRSITMDHDVDYSSTSPNVLDRSDSLSKPDGLANMKDGTTATTQRKNRNPHATQLPGNGTRKGIKAEATNDHVGPSCSHCAAITTPLWRRGKADELLCNACGLYEKLHGISRPINYSKQSVGLRGKTASGAASLAAASIVPPSCSNCGATSTPMWRKDADKRLCCNACSLYFKLHGKPRPSSLSSRQPERNRKSAAAAAAAAASAFTAAPLSRSLSSVSPLRPPATPSAAPAIILPISRSASTSPSSIGSLSPPPPPLSQSHHSTQIPSTTLSRSVNLSISISPLPSPLAPYPAQSSPKLVPLSPALYTSRVSASSALAWRSSLTPEIRSASPIYAASERGGSANDMPSRTDSNRIEGHGPDDAPWGGRRARGKEEDVQVDQPDGGVAIDAVGNAVGALTTTTTRIVGKRPRVDSWERGGGAALLLSVSSMDHGK